MVKMWAREYYPADLADSERHTHFFGGEAMNTILCNYTEYQNEALDEIRKQPLAFSNSSDHVSATARMPFITQDGSATLNVECFFFQDEQRGKMNPAPLILYVHGVCASSETLGVQHLVLEAKKKKYRVAVLELEGHGLSSGERAVCTDFSRLVGHVKEFAKHVLTQISKENGGTRETPFLLSGTSLGGILTAYAIEDISKDLSNYPGHFIGSVLLSPAVGVDPDVIPSPILLSALTVLSYFAPGAKLPFTPNEDPSSYAAPKNSTRNYSGQWPLGTSKMLLDVTSKRVFNDFKNGSIKLKKVNSLLLFAGENDDIVPFKKVQDFFEAIEAREKALIRVPGAGHDMMYHVNSASEIVTQIFQWIDLRIWAAERVRENT